MCESYWTETYLKISGASRHRCIGIAGCLCYNRGRFSRLLRKALVVWYIVKWGGGIIKRPFFPNIGLGTCFLGAWKLPIGISKPCARIMLCTCLLWKVKWFVWGLVWSLCHFQHTFFFSLWELRIKLLCVFQLWVLFTPSQHEYLIQKKVSHTFKVRILFFDERNGHNPLPQSDKRKIKTQIKSCNILHHGFGQTNPVHLFLVGCLNPCLQGTNVRVVSPQPYTTWVVEH